MKEEKKELFTYTTLDKYDYYDLIPEYVVHYLKAFGVSLYKKRFVSYNKDKDALCYQAGFKFKDKDLVARRVKSIDEIFWRIDDGNDLALYNDHIDVRRELSFYKKCFDDNYCFNWAIKYDKLRNGLSLQFRGALGIFTKLLILQDISGSIKLSLYYVSFGERHIIIDEIMEEDKTYDLIKEFDFDSYRKEVDNKYGIRFKKEIFDEMLNSEFSLIKAMFNDPRIEEIIKRMIERKPGLMFKKMVNDINHKYDDKFKMLDDEYLTKKNELQSLKEQEIAEVQEQFNMKNQESKSEKVFKLS